MTKTNLLLSFVMTLILLSCNLSSPTKVSYIDKELPQIEPKIFAQDFISYDTTSEYGSVFNQKNTEFYYAIDANGRSKINYSYLKDTSWSKPVTIISDPSYSFNDPFLSPDNAKLYYISDLPKNAQDTINDIDIWYSERQGKQWSPPINAGPMINSEGNEYYISFTQDGSMYFSTNKEHYNDRKHNFDIYRSQWTTEGFEAPQKLPEAINTRAYEADVFIAPDESYIIFCSARRSGLGRGDLYFSYKDQNEKWTTAVNMGAPINSSAHEICPFVTPDGQFLFYTSNQDIYWVSTQILERYK